ncbi:hypothetical protein F4604DRAFT_1595374, partial [Suillus subluteus]
ALCQKFRQVVKGVAESKAAFEMLNQSTNKNQVRDWEEQEKLAQEQCSNDPTAMDIYEVQLRKGASPEVLPHVNGQRLGTACCRGAATWLAEGLSIEETQVTLQMDV